MSVISMQSSVPTFVEFIVDVIIYPIYIYVTVEGNR